LIDAYSDHAENERTFLTWLRTDVAVIAFGFVTEKFNFFLLTLPDAVLARRAYRSQLYQCRSRNAFPATKKKE
jgi:putative membrane protein